MDFVSITGTAAVIGLLFCVLVIALRLIKLLDRPFKKDLSRAKGSSGRAILFAFTLGMAPWEKESTRIHWIAYIRGIIFHVGIFTALAVLAASPWLEYIPDWVQWAAMAITAVGAAAAFGGIWLRLSEANLRLLSLPDDYFSVLLTGLFITFAFLIFVVPGSLPVFYLISAFMFLYIPFSKIRHCVYFFYSKFFFGLSFGHRGSIGQKPGQYAE